MQAPSSSRCNELAIAGALLVGSSALSSLFFLWLWHEQAILAGFTGVFLLFGGAMLLPERTTRLHSASIGLVVGYLVGLCLFFGRYAQ
jgi:hypothetical protein